MPSIVDCDACISEQLLELMTDIFEYDEILYRAQEDKIIFHSKEKVAIVITRQSSTRS